VPIFQPDSQNPPTHPTPTSPCGLIAHLFTQPTSQVPSVIYYRRNLRRRFTNDRECHLLVLPVVGDRGSETNGDQVYYSSNFVDYTHYYSSTAYYTNQNGGCILNGLNNSPGAI